MCSPEFTQKWHYWEINPQKQLIIYGEHQFLYIKKQNICLNKNYTK